MDGYTLSHSGYEHIVIGVPSAIKIAVQKEGFLICGKPKEIRYLLKTYASRYRTVKELIIQNLN